MYLLLLYVAGVVSEQGEFANCHGFKPTVTPRGGDDTFQVDLDGVECKVAWISHERNPDTLQSTLKDNDFVLTDSLKTVPFAARNGQVIFLEKLHPMPRIGNEALDAILAAKDNLLSILLPRDTSSSWEDETTSLLAQQAVDLLPQHTFIDDGLGSTLERAFRKYRFTLIVDDELHTLSQALVHAIAWGSIPFFNGFSFMLAMLPRVVLPWNRSSFRLDQFLSIVPEINHEIGPIWQQHRLLNDQLFYRYAYDFDRAFRHFSCTLCSSVRDSRLVEEQADSLLLFVGVYSAQDNFAKRAVIRRTWGRVFQLYGHVKFFLGRPDERFATQVRAEIQKHQDMVLLDVPEGYQWNSMKGLRFLEWCSSNVLAQFLVKVDDDVYVRPLPLISLLRQRPQVGYVWGYFDYFSPVPREEGHAFYNSEDFYPFDAFPPYARGLLRALSMDVVHGLASLSHGIRVIAGDDPSFGVHLRYLRDETGLVARLTLDDRDSYRVFAMEPSCNPSLWSHVTHRSWVIHHVTPQQIQCIWDVDVEAGIYEDREALLHVGAAYQHHAEVDAKFATNPDLQELSPLVSLQELCSCLENGPYAAELSQRKDKINASRTFMMWGHPSLLDQEDEP
ncbi:3-galactosyltransferase 16) [Durusdinium trenchii]